MKPVIYLDMDGVLADFVGHAARLFNVDLHRAPRVYDIAKVVGLPYDRVNRAIRNNPQFWESVPVLPWAQQLVEEVRKLGTMHVLTAPWPLCDVCPVEKKSWCYVNLGIQPEHVILSDDKAQHAARGRILVDDLEENCSRWHHAGGRSVLFPARHNRYATLLGDPSPGIVRRIINQIVIAQ